MSVAVGFSRTCPIDGGLEHSPADHGRRPTVPLDSPTPGLDHLQFEATLDRRPALEQPVRPCLAVPGLFGLRIFETVGADIDDLRQAHGHRVLRVRGKGGRQPVRSSMRPPRGPYA